MTNGQILVNTGPGKGKTTAALGVTLRALGHGQKVAFLQFIKSQETGESLFLKEYGRNNPGRLYYNRFGLGCVRGQASAEDMALAAQALAASQELLASRAYDLVVLDEACVAAAKGLISPADLVELVKSKPLETNLILTGRGCPAEVIALADTVTEMGEIKHAYQKGIPALSGLDF